MIMRFVPSGRTLREIFTPGSVVICDDPRVGRHVARNGDPQNNGEHDQNHQNDRDDF